MSGIFCCGVITALLLFNSTEINSPHIYSTFFTVTDYFTFESVKDLFLYFVEAWDLILSINPVQLYELYFSPWHIKVSRVNSGKLGHFLPFRWLGKCTIYPELSVQLLHNIHSIKTSSSCFLFWLLVQKLDAAVHCIGNRCPKHAI